MAIENALNNRRTGIKIPRNSVFYLPPKGRQMAIENYVSNDFYLHLSIVFTFSIATYPVYYSGLTCPIAIYLGLHYLPNYFNIQRQGYCWDGTR